MVKIWEKVLVSPTLTIREVIQKIDSSALQIALVVDGSRCLLGTVTDGDVRRGILKGFSLEQSVVDVMNPHPTVAGMSDDRDSVLALMKARHLRQIPVVDDLGRIFNLETLEGLLNPVEQENWVVLMAGGLGSRLRPITDECPKPLLRIGGKPLLETIVTHFRSFGFRKIFLSVNYKAEMIEEYFGDGRAWDVEINYLRESERLGTAGALRLLPERPSQPLLVMNGDLLTRVNFQQLLAFHNEQGADATMCVRNHEYQVPYGVARVESHQLTRIEEKPIYHFFVNAGIYVLQPSAIEIIPPSCFYDMPSLFSELLASRRHAAVFPIREYWLDIGRLEDFERANGEYREVFG